MRFNTSIAIILLACIAWLGACKKGTSIDPPDFKAEYQPVEIGHWVEYRVDSIVYTFADPFVFSDTLTFELREEVTDSFRDLSGDLTFELTRFRRAPGDSVWGVDRVWKTNPYVDRVEKTEDEFRYIKLIFPPKQGDDWNGTIYINTTADEVEEYIRPGKDWTFNYTSVDEAATIGSFNLDSTLTVVHVDDSNKIERDYSIEIYAKGIGLVYKDIRILDKQNVLNFWNEPEEGFIVIHTLLGYRQ